MYEQEIRNILAAVGDEGITVQKLAMHVYNERNGLFEQADLDDIRRHVQRFLLKNSQSAASLVERMDERGRYRLNPHSAETMQLMLDFSEPADDDKPQTEATPIDLSLDLFA